MSVSSLRLMRRSKGQDRDKATYETQWLVQTTDLADGPEAAETAMLGLALPAGYFLSGLTVAHHASNPLWFECKATLETPPWDALIPTDLRSILSITYDETTEPYFTDHDQGDPDDPDYPLDGKLVLNSAGERFESFPERPAGKAVLNLLKNLPSFPFTAFEAIKYTRNAVEVTIKGETFPPGSLLFLPATCQETVEQVVNVKYLYYATTYRLRVDMETLHLDILEDRGLMQLYDTGEVDEDLNPIRKQWPIPLSQGQAPETPWPLDGDGNALPNADDDPAQLTFYPFVDADWGLDFD